MLTLNLLIAGGCLYRLMLAFQQSGYKRLSISDYNKSSYCFGLISMLFAFVSVSVDIILRDLIIFYTAGAIVMIIMVLQLYLIYSKPYKKPLKFTPRVIRLYIITLIIIGLYQLLYFTEFRCLIWMVYLLLPPIILLANLILYPFEQINNKKYIRNAEVKLNAFKGIKIGITGSFGKTTVKNFLREILSRKYNTLATPESFNTPLGISRTVQKLEENTEVFIAEMGARRKGDIKELCDIVKPSIGIVTGVNNQHSETFKSIDNTFRTKYELLENLTGNRFAVVNGDNEYTLKMSELNNSITVGFNDKCACKIINLNSTISGTSFEVEHEGEHYSFRYII